jgi:excisionase family DNA binding protein
MVRNRPVFEREHVVLSGIDRDDSDDMSRSMLLEQAATLLGVSRRTVYYRIREGRLQTVRTMGGSQRVLVESIERLLREDMGLTVPGAVASDTGLSAKSPAL